MPDRDLQKMMDGPMLGERERRELFLRPTTHPGQRRTPQAKGYAGTPGLGPEGETCKTCTHSAVKSQKGGVKGGNYWGCRLVRWTNGLGTDIRLKSAACQRFEPRRKDHHP